MPRKQASKPSVPSRMNILTPVGRAALCWLDKPSTLHNPDGVYQCDLYVPGDDPGMIAFEEALQAFAEAYHEAYDLDCPIKLPIHDGEDKETGQKTGEKFIRMKLPVISKLTGMQQEPIIVDSKGNPVIPKPSIGNGSRLRISGSARCSNFKGQTLYVPIDLKIVQVIELVDFRAAARAQEEEDLKSLITPVSGGYVSDAIPGNAPEDQVHTPGTPGTVPF